MPVFLSFGHMDTNVCVIMIGINRLTYSRTSVYNLNYHLIWGIKYRNKVLKGHVETVKRTLMKLLQNTDLRLLTWRLEKMTTFTYW